MVCLSRYIFKFLTLTNSFLIVINCLFSFHAPLQIIVATPGRLLDHVENRSGLSVRLMGLTMLILDEADLLLDLGFRKDIEKIVDCLPRRRQSLMFSATVPREVRSFSLLYTSLGRSHLCFKSLHESWWTCRSGEYLS